MSASVELLPPPELRASIEGILRDGASLGPSALALNLRDLIVLAFETGDVQQGKGERLLLQQMLLEIGRTCPETVCRLLPLVPRYSSYRTLR